MHSRITVSEMLEVTGVLSGASKTGTQDFKFVVQNSPTETQSRMIQVYPAATAFWNFHIPSHLDIQLRRWIEGLENSMAFRLILLKCFRCCENSFVEEDKH